MDKSTLFELSKGLECGYEIGVWSETTDFLERQEKVIDFSLAFEEEKEQYNLWIKLEEYSKINVIEMFGSLVQFLEYKSTFYVREDQVNSMSYYFLSSTETKKAFIFHIVFC